jgi:hypothetical protein
MLEPLVARAGVVAVPDHAGVYLAGNASPCSAVTSMMFWAPSSRIEGAVASSLSGTQTSGACMPRNWPALRSIFAESSSPSTAVGDVKNVRTNFLSRVRSSTLMFTRRLGEQRF